MGQWTFLLDDSSCDNVKTVTQLPTPVHTPPTSPCSTFDLDVQKQQFRFDKLSPELRYIIFSQLCKVNSRTAHCCRLVSRHFEAWVTPTMYQTLEVDERLLDLFSDPDAAPAVAPIISSHTRHLILRSDLDSERLQRLLPLVTNLISMRWRYVENSLDCGNFWPPPAVLRYIQDGTKLHVEDLPPRTTKNDVSLEYAEAIPAEALRTVRLARGPPPLITWLTQLKRILIRATNLDTLHYQEYGRGTSFEFRPGERLPPIKNLLLNSYYWNHSQEQVQQHWNFSRIESLRLTSVPMRAFLSSISMHDFANLHTLQLEDRNVYANEDEYGQATDLMATLIGDHIRALIHLDITCDVRRLPIEAIMRHKDFLEFLRIRDNTGFEEDDDVMCPTLPVEAVAALAKAFPHVRTLELDMDTAVCDPVNFVQAIAGFRSLRQLTIHTQAVGASSSCTSLSHVSGHDADRNIIRRASNASAHDLALCTALGLLQKMLAKHGTIQIDENTALAVPLLQRVTINIGGWRPVMLRRVAATWKQKNQDGIYAERCFVLKRPRFKSSFFVTELVAREPSVSAAPRPIPTPFSHLFDRGLMAGVC